MQQWGPWPSMKTPPTSPRGCLVGRQALHYENVFICLEKLEILPMWNLLISFMLAYLNVDWLYLHFSFCFKVSNSLNGNINCFYNETLIFLKAEELCNKSYTNKYSTSWDLSNNKSNKKPVFYSLIHFLYFKVLNTFCFWT